VLLPADTGRQEEDTNLILVYPLPGIHLPTLVREAASSQAIHMVPDELEGIHTLVQLLLLVHLRTPQVRRAQLEKTIARVYGLLLETPLLQDTADVGVGPSS
jgi:hypothetical protein